MQALAFEGPEIGMFRDAAALPQPLQHVAERWFGAEPFRLETPQRGKRGIEEFKPLVGTVDRYGRADAFEHLGVGADVAPQPGFGDLDVGPVERKADRSSVSSRQLGDFEQTAGRRRSRHGP